MSIAETVTVEKFAKALNLEVLCKGRGEVTFDTVSVSRPGLQLTGYFEYFGGNRIQVMGNAEMRYVSTLDEETQKKALSNILERGIPCLIISREIEVSPLMLKLAEKYKVPLLRSELVTTMLVNQIVIYLNKLLAPQVTKHAELLDIYGVGVLLTGNSGIGKSETALELVKRGHRLVADDSVIIKQIQDTLIGTSPSKIRYFMEIRGIGIIDVRSIYGAGSVLLEKQIDMVVNMQNWDDTKSYDRLGTENLNERILGIDLPRLEIPIRPGRNLAIVLEAAATNFRLKTSLGYDAAKVLLTRTDLDN